MTPEAAQHLRAVTTADLLVDPSTGEPVDASYRVRDLEDQLAGMVTTVEKQARMIGSLERRVTQEEDIESHPRGSEIVALIDRWKARCRHEKARTSADRVKLVKARLKDGYSPAEIAMAIDGLASVPYVVNAQRRAEGNESQRYDQLKHALNGGQDLERFVNLGYQARKAGRIDWPEWGDES